MESEIEGVWRLEDGRYIGVHDMRIVAVGDDPMQVQRAYTQTLPEGYDDGGGMG